METLEAEVLNIVYTDEASGYTVAKAQVLPHLSPITLVGHLPGLFAGERIQASGKHDTHPSFGKQFQVASFELKLPTHVAGIERYLASGIIKGIGKSYAKKIVEAFKENTLEIIENQPEKLKSVEGLGFKRIQSIHSSYLQNKTSRALLISLYALGLSQNFALKLIKTYKDKALEKLKNNPYQIAKEMRGIGFKTADKIAEGCGIKKDSPLRITSALDHFLWEFAQEGHTGFLKQSLIDYAVKELGLGESLIALTIDKMIESKELYQMEDLVFSPSLYLAELGIALELDRIAQGLSKIRTVDVDKAILWAEQVKSITLETEQKKAVKAALQEKLLLITGGPGTGKSTITKVILAIYEKISQKIFLAAPTGKAAKRMSEITQKKAQTIHALLEFDPVGGGFKRNHQNKLDVELLILDETSMIDTFLLFSLLKAIPQETKVLLIGDIDQLPSVGPGQTLKDLIESDKFPVSRLKTIFRQAATSRIITNAHMINSGDFPDLRFDKNSDFEFYPLEDPALIEAKIIDLIQEKLSKWHKFHKLKDIQVLTPMKKGSVGADSLNVALQKAINPHSEFIERFGRRFSLHDKVMQLKNNYQKEITNGSVGIIGKIDHEEECLSVVFEDKWINYDFDELDELTLAYAISIHKFQGSECPCIIIPIHISHFKLLFRNLLYTGITRGKQRVILIGSKKALAIGIRNQDSLKRTTGLKKHLESVCACSFQKD
jgi:exodeoxyribonuclease V alpha subunit